MRSGHDPVKLLQRANPVPVADVYAGGHRTAAARALVEDILGDHQREPATRSRPRRATLALAAAMLVAGATAAWAYTFSGMFSEPAFSGETWKLTVGEESNGPAADTYKVCYTFEPRLGANMGNGLGTAGCGDWPSTARGSAIIDVVPAVETNDGVVLFIDLTTEPIGTVSVVPNRGGSVDVQPYVMPQSRKQFAVVELPPNVRSATVRLLDLDGQLMERRTVEDLTVRR